MSNSQKIYAITFDLDIELLQQLYNGNVCDAHNQIKLFFEKEGFYRYYGNVFFGNESINAVNCVVAVTKITKQFCWFSICVKDIRMLRIEEINDLYPAMFIV